MTATIYHVNVGSMVDSSRVRVGRGAVVLAGLLAAVSACGPRLPPPPPYTPELTPEPETRCPKEHAAAKAAREAFIGEEAPGLGARAAGTAFAHAECERAVLDGMTIDALDDAIFKKSIEAVKSQTYTTQNLYLEATRYGALDWAIRGHAGVGALHVVYGDKLRRTEAPVALSDPASLAAWRTEVELLARRVAHDGAAYFTQAIEGYELAPAELRAQPELAKTLRAACAALAELEGPGVAMPGACR